MRIITVLLCLTFGCKESSIEYISKPSGNVVLSYFPYYDEKLNRNIILSYGKTYDNTKLPESYIKVKDKAFDGWECLIKCYSDTVVVYQPYYKLEGVNLENESKLKLRKLADTTFYSIYFDIEDTSYIRLQSK